MQDKLHQLKEALYPYVDLTAASNLLEWDQETYMPPGGGGPRADQISTLSELAHRAITSDEVGRLLDDLKPYEAQLDPASDEAALIRVTRREYEKRVKVPAGLVADIKRQASLGTEAWKKARTQKDFSLFEPALSKMVDLRLRWAECFRPYANIYDPLCDDYEPGMSYDQIAAVFAGLKPPLVELVQGIVAHQDAVDDSIMHGHFDGAAQMAFCEAVARDIGYRFENGRLDTTAHPFTTGFGRDDVRITTRVEEAFFPSCLMSVVHEAGHGMYEQNTGEALYRTILAQGASMAVHESQSRFFENILGRSRAFWQRTFPRVKAAFPQFRDADLEAFYRALNKSQPSLVRVEADEVTYGLHIILRFELENDLVNGRVKVADLPAEWNARMEAYLGVVPADDGEGVLQDIHWSQGYIGYFPDYLLGSIFSVQIWNQMQKDLPDVEQQIEAGQFGDILAWQVEKVHRHGMKFTLPELAERAVGGPLAWEPYMAYLSSKYGEIYGL
jgi:carboxypeptidase Taq